MAGKSKVDQSRAMTISARSQVPPARSRGCWGSFVALLLLVAGMGLVVGSAQLALQLMVDPNSLVWLDRFLPNRSNQADYDQSKLQTLAEIKSSLRQEGFIPGEEIWLESPAGKKAGAPSPDLLLPVQIESTGCPSGIGGAPDGSCLAVVELRVYQPVNLGMSAGQSAQTMPKKANLPKSTQYWLVNQLAIDGPEESTAIAPLVTAQSDNQGSTTILPLTQITPFEEKVPDFGIWLNLRGSWRHSNQIIYYGQVIHYNPDRTYLSSLLSWTSTAGDATWQDFTGGGTPELIVDQKVGMEPNFRVYRVQPRRFLPNPIQLEQITLTQPAVNNQTYRQILYLARAGLWSPALQWLQSVKSKTPPKQWSKELQAQMDLIQLHAKATQTQAEQNWASPAQQLSAYLIDGRWSRATNFLRKNNQYPEEVVNLLTNDGDRLWNRVEVALKINPKRRDVQAWGALILTARQSKAKAIAWLKKQPGYAQDAQLEKLLTSLEPAPVGSNPGGGQFGTGNTYLSRIVGAGRSVEGVNLATWLVPPGNPKPVLNPGESWYEIEVNEFQDGQRWQRSPFTSLAVSRGTIDKIWKLLGLNNDNQVQLTLSISPDQQQTISVFVQALRNQGGKLQLLASGDSIVLDAKATANSAPPALALTSDAATWLEGEPTNLATLQQENPQQANVLFIQLWRELQRSGYLPTGPVPSFATALSQTEIGGWAIQRIDLTGNDQPDFTLRVNAETLSALKTSQQGSGAVDLNGSPALIFSDAGTLIYSELSLDANQILTGIVALPDRSTAALLIYADRSYSFQRWSAANVRFQ